MDVRSLFYFPFFAVLAAIGFGLKKLVQSLWADAGRIIVNRKQNAATDTAALIIPAVGYNKLRHETLQRFMLVNDSVTIAIEIPIWMREHDITALEWQLHTQVTARRGDKTPPKTSPGVPLTQLSV
jgi:hypothetical protein